MAIKIGSLGLPRATGQWQCRVDGKSVYLGKVREIAEAKRAALVESSTVANRSPVENDSQATTQELVDIFLSEATRTTRKNESIRRKFLDRFLVEFGDRPPVKIKALDVERWVDGVASWGAR